MTRAAVAIRVGLRSRSIVAMASFIGFVAFLWPFVVAPGKFGDTSMAPLMFGALLVLVLAIVFAEIAGGGIDAKAIAMLGVLSAIGAALRPLGAGTAGIEMVFFILVIAGRVFGPGFGFVLGCTTLFASALITGGVGPWMPYQMFGCAWVGLFAGLLPPATGRREVFMLALYGALTGYLFGFMLNLSFWPFYLDPQSSIAYRAGWVARRQCAPLPDLRRHHLARVGHRSGRHQLRRHPPGRIGHAGDIPSGGAAGRPSRRRSVSSDPTDSRGQSATKADRLEPVVCRCRSTWQ